MLALFSTGVFTILLLGSFITGAAPMAAVANGPSDAGFTGNTVMALSLLIGTVASVFGIAAFFRRQPPIGEQMHQAFATKEELAVARKEAAESVRRIHQRIDVVLHEVSKNHADSELARGRLFGQVEGISDAIAAMRHDLRGVTRTK